MSKKPKQRPDHAVEEWTFARLDDLLIRLANDPPRPTKPTGVSPLPPTRRLPSAHHQRKHRHS